MTNSTQLQLQKRRYSIEQYNNIVKTIYEMHISHTGKWLARQKGVTHYNLKKTEIRTVVLENEEGSKSIDQGFYDYLINFKSELIYLYADIIKSIKQDYDLDIKGRIKNEDSIINKLQKKKSDQNGAFSINKVMNDLLGFRIIDGNYEHNVKNLIIYLENLKEKEGYRFMHKERINGDYKGYHIYFMGKDAKFFPIELQIWDTKNEKTNLDSHEVYKKDYTVWPEIYNKG